ncbi:replication-relaxation family protein [Salisediminibacterium halotolerans]|nr:replication-relaxation family protein [Salisediminibacterium halotolerans]
MNVLFDLGFATKDQLNAILEWQESPYKLGNELKKLRKLEKNVNKRYIQTFQLPAKAKHRSPVAYTLTKQGIQYICQYRGIQNEKLKPAKEGQWKHYLGIAEIIATIKDSRLNEAAVEFSSEYMTARQIQHIVNLYDTKKDRKPYEFIKHFKPDALMKIGGQEFFLEYDTGTENMQKIEAKMLLILDTLFYKNGEKRGYIKELNKPFVWVTTSSVRAKNLGVVWGRVQQLDKYRKLLNNMASQHIALPTMTFLTDDQVVAALEKKVLGREAPPKLRRNRSVNE